MRLLISICIAGLVLAAVEWLVSPYHLHAAPAIAKSVNMRPYSGIGLLLLASPAESQADLPELPVLYKEPSLFRIGRLETSKPSPYEWILGAGDKSARLIVTSRKGDWLKVVYDDAGREAWLKPPSKARYLPWDSFLKGRSVTLLAGLQKKYYQTSTQMGGVPSGTLASRQLFRIISVENDWVMVMPGRESLTWLRWRDEDGRLLIGIENQSAGSL